MRYSCAIKCLRSTSICFAVLPTPVPANAPLELAVPWSKGEDAPGALPARRGEACGEPDEACCSNLAVPLRTGELGPFVLSDKARLCPPRAPPEGKPLSEPVADEPGR